MNSLPRCDISITDIPEPFQSTISSRARSNTSNGSMAGPALKLYRRSVVFSDAYKHPHVSVPGGVGGGLHWITRTG
jgi:hypothetical protein